MEPLDDILENANQERLREVDRFFEQERKRIRGYLGPRAALIGMGIGLVISIAVLVVAAMARSEGPGRDAPPPPGMRWWTAEDAQPLPEGAPRDPKLGRRPFDDSDPEMRTLAEAFFTQGPCNRGPGGRCPEAKAPLKAGGDRLARYLIRQYEQSIAEGYEDTATLLTAIAGTTSAEGTEFVVRVVDRPRDDRERDFGLSALEECESDRAVDKALDILSRIPESDWSTRAGAIRAIQVNIDEGKLDRPDVLRELEAIRSRGSVSEMERRAADRALQRIEKGREQAE